jgi:lysozyme family protein
MSSTNDAFSRAFAATMQHEGGYANVVGDKGGETYMGISRVYWPSWPGWPVIDDWRAERVNALQRDTMLTEHVLAFYRAQFWDRLRGDELAELSIPIALEMFDTAVNMGVGRAVRFLQEALNMLNRGGRTYADIAVDGLIGRDTLNTLKRCLETQPGSRESNERLILNCLNGEQYIAYKQNPQHEQFAGWFARV